MATTKSAPKSEADATFTESELSPAMQTLKPGGGTGGGGVGHRTARGRLCAGDREGLHDAGRRRSIRLRAER